LAKNRQGLFVFGTRCVNPVITVSLLPRPLFSP